MWAATLPRIIGKIFRVIEVTTCLLRILNVNYLKLPGTLL